METKVKVLTVIVDSYLIYEQALTNWFNGGCTIINSGYTDGAWYATAQFPASTPTKFLQLKKYDDDTEYYVVEGVDLDKLNTEGGE